MLNKQHGLSFKSFIRKNVYIDHAINEMEDYERLVDESHVHIAIDMPTQ